MFGADQFIAMFAAPAENLLAKNINEMLSNHSQKMDGALIDDQKKELYERSNEKSLHWKRKADRKGRTDHSILIQDLGDRATSQDS